MWHRLLIFLGIRNELDWSPPGLGPEVNHSYMPHQTLRCCEHCGGGRLNPIHKPPYDPRRMAQILSLYSTVSNPPDAFDRFVAETARVPREH